MYTFKWFREFPIMQACHISVCPSHKLVGKVSKRTHRKDRNEEGWKAVVGRQSAHLAGMPWIL